MNVSKTLYGTLIGVILVSLFLLYSARPSIRLARIVGEDFSKSNVSIVYSGNNAGEASYLFKISNDKHVQEYIKSFNRNSGFLTGERMFYGKNLKPPIYQKRINGFLVSTGGCDLDWVYIVCEKY